MHCYLAESSQLEHIGHPVVLQPGNETSVTVTNVNYPLPAPSNIIFKTSVTADAGHNVRLSLPVREWNQNCESGNFLEVWQNEFTVELDFGAL